jgi:type VI secretion system secreted protein VgrG
MGKKSGKAGKAVSPAAPKKPEDADLADPGKMAEIKAEQAKTKSGKYGSAKVKPFKPPTEEEKEEKKEELSWIEIEMVDEEDEPVPGEKYKITLPDDSVAEGTLDEKGFARVEGFEKGTCKICFPDIDKEAWEKV